MAKAKMTRKITLGDSNTTLTMELKLTPNPCEDGIHGLNQKELDAVLTGVVREVVRALLNNNVPYSDYGVETLSIR